jgi:hypothetical protein
MNNSTKARLIMMLDREFDKTVVSIFNKQQLMDKSRSFHEKAKYAAEAAELESYLGTLLTMAEQILEG